MWGCTKLPKTNKHQTKSQLKSFRASLHTHSQCSQLFCVIDFLRRSLHLVLRWTSWSIAIGNLRIPKIKANKMFQKNWVPLNLQIIRWMLSMYLCCANILNEQFSGCTLMNVAYFRPLCVHVSGIFRTMYWLSWGVSKQNETDKKRSFFVCTNIIEQNQWCT